MASAYRKVKQKLGKIKRIVSFNLSGIRNKKIKNFFQLKNGFYDSTVKFNNITSSNYKNFLSDTDYRLGHPWNGPYSPIIDNKLFLPYLLNRYKEYLPKTWFFKDKNGFLPIFNGISIDEFKNKTRIETNDAMTFLASQKKIVLKHTHSAVGQGFHFISFENDKWILDNKEISENKLSDFLEQLDEYIIQEYIIQAKYSLAINASSINTIRLQCAFNQKKKSFEIIRAFHRFGTSGQLVDNLGKGNGILVYIDPKSGITKKEGVLSKNGIYSLKCNDIYHPDSGLKLSEFCIPGYGELKNKIIEISNSISYLKWLGWDIAMTDDGFKIIEINSLTTLDTIQQGEGFLEVDWLTDIFKKKI